MFTVTQRVPALEAPALVPGGFTSLVMAEVPCAWLAPFPHKVALSLCLSSVRPGAGLRFESRIQATPASLSFGVWLPGVPAVRWAWQHFQLERSGGKETILEICSFGPDVFASPCRSIFCFCKIPLLFTETVFLTGRKTKSFVGEGVFLFSFACLLFCFLILQNPQSSTIE